MLENGCLAISLKSMMVRRVHDNRVKAQLQKIEHKFYKDWWCWNKASLFLGNLSMENQVSKTCSTAFYQIRNIRHVRKYVDLKSTETMVHAFITNKLDYCNSLLYGLPDYQIQKLQRVQNAAARIITGMKKVWSHHSCIKGAALATCKTKTWIQDIVANIQSIE